MSKVYALTEAEGTKAQALFAQAVTAAMLAFEQNPEVTIGITMLCSLAHATQSSTPDPYRSHQQDMADKLAAALPTKLVRLPIPVKTDATASLTEKEIAPFFAATNSFIHTKNSLLLVLTDKGKQLFYPAGKKKSKQKIKRTVLAMAALTFSSMQPCPSAAASIVARFEMQYKKWWGALYVGEIPGASLLMGKKARRNLLDSPEYTAHETAENKLKFLTTHAARKPGGTTATLLKTMGIPLSQPVAAAAAT